jgi:hypothetical protein
MKKDEFLPSIIHSITHSDEATTQKEEFGNAPSPPFKLEMLSFASSPEQIIFLRKDGNFVKFGLFPSNFPSTISKVPLETDKPPFEEFEIAVSFIFVSEEERWMREEDQEHTGFNSVGSPFSSLCPTNTQYSIVTAGDEERDIIIPSLTGDKQVVKEHP